MLNWRVMLSGCDSSFPREKPKSEELGLLTSHEVSYPVKAVEPDWISGFAEAA